MSAWIENRIGELAASQHGVVTRGQLLGAGLSERMVEWRLKMGRLRPLHSGVYLASPVRPPRAREMAAVLAGGVGARASHRSAGWLWDLVARPPDAAPPELKVPPRRVVRRPGLLVYRGEDLKGETVGRVDGIPVTSPATTLVDLARVLPVRALEKAVAGADRAGLVGSSELGALVDRNRGRRGIAALAAVMEYEGGPAFTRSELEDRFVDQVRRFGLPAPRSNVRVRGFEVDCYWTMSRLAVELDGARYHGGWRSRQDDRRRDAVLATADIQVIRVTWHQLVHETEPTMVRIAQALALRRERRRTEQG